MAELGEVNNGQGGLKVVNPILQTSKDKLRAEKWQFLVGETKSRKLLNIGVDPNRTMKDGLFDPIKRYYVIDKQPHEFFYDVESPSKQATYKFIVKFHFTLAVKDPCAIVENNISDLLKCVSKSLNRLIAETTDVYEIRSSKEAQKSAQTNIDQFIPPSFLAFEPGRVEVVPDPEARAFLRQKDEMQIKLEGIKANSAAETVEGMGKRVKDLAAEKVESHHLGEMVHSNIKGLISSDESNA